MQCYKCARPASWAAEKNNETIKCCLLHLYLDDITDNEKKTLLDYNVALAQQKDLKLLMYKCWDDILDSAKSNREMFDSLLNGTNAATNGGIGKTSSSNAAAGGVSEDETNPTPNTNRDKEEKRQRVHIFQTVNNAVVTNQKQQVDGHFPGKTTNPAALFVSDDEEEAGEEEDNNHGKGRISLLKQKELDDIIEAQAPPNVKASVQRKKAVSLLLKTYFTLSRESLQACLTKAVEAESKLDFASPSYSEAVRSACFHLKNPAAGNGVDLSRVRRAREFVPLEVKSSTTVQCQNCFSTEVLLVNVQNALTSSKADTWGSSDRAEATSKYACQKCGCIFTKD